MRKMLFFIPAIFLSLSFVNGDSGVCGAGYVFDWNSERCLGVNECHELSSCPSDYECVNIEGGYSCYSPDGKIFTYGGGSSNFDPTKYNVNEREDWGFYEIKAELDAGARVTLPNGKIVKLSVGSSVNLVIRYPDCKTSPNNLCIKTHIDKPIQYL